MRHVLDLTPLYKRPDPDSLLGTLEDLQVLPATFDGRSNSSSNELAIAEEGIPRYLTSIVGSPLAWIEDEETRERIWDLASKRLSERSGRTAQPSFQRTFSIPDGGSFIEVRLKEPSMTGDNLGHKTWASAYLLAKRLPSLLKSVPPLASQFQPSEHGKALLPRVLELGAGTGLTGLALALLAPCTVHLTDLPEIVPNLASNIALNKSSLCEKQPLSTASSFSLDWSKLSRQNVPESQRYDFIIAADPLYSPEHPALVVAAITTYLRHNPDARLMVELPLRDAYVMEREVMRMGLEESNLMLVESGEDTGYDDWGGGGTEVVCHWGLWAWKG